MPAGGAAPITARMRLFWQHPAQLRPTNDMQVIMRNVLHTMGAGV